MTFSLPPLPYEKNALQPHISEETLGFHHEKHHQTYVTNLNKLVEGSEFSGNSLEEIIVKTSQKNKHAGIFNNAAQVWNHTFYWHSLSPNGGGEPTGSFADKLHQDFGSFSAFKEAFTQAALTQFGSGWAWLVLDKGTLKVVKTGNAETPLTNGQTPLLTCDVWEHAYYIDYRNRRPDYVGTFLNHLANWDFAVENFSKA
ncbi:MAG: superoxide dismutase [bacterium]|nr:superoxide dismutase [bacterium]